MRMLSWTEVLRIALAGLLLLVGVFLPVGMRGALWAAEPAASDRRQLLAFFLPSATRSGRRCGRCWRL